MSDRFNKCYSKLLSENKAFEAQFTKWEQWFTFGFEFSWTRKTDHAGIRFNVTILGFYFSVVLYDTRHWDEDDWEDYNEENT